MADLSAGDTVWLTPKTMGAPAICYGQPRAKVTRLAWPYVVVTVNGREHRIHHDNIRRSDPTRSRGVVHVRPTPRPALPDDCQEQTLW